MQYILFSDESGISSVDQCYTIGALIIPKSYVATFHKFLQLLKKQYNIKHEMKWKNVNTSYNVMNFAIDLMKELFKGPVIFTCIVVLKAKYRKWAENKETAFYTTYSLLMEHIARVLEGEIEAQIDERSDAYSKHHEVVEIITNYKLHSYEGNISKVKKVDSKEYIEIQAVDILTGAINAGHNLYLNPSVQIHSGKILLLQRLATMVGWDVLQYDTYPNAEFNIWHFPMEEYRSVPDTKNIWPNLNIPYISHEELVRVCSESGM